MLLKNDQASEHPIIVRERGKIDVFLDKKLSIVNGRTIELRLDYHD